ncbi:MAG: DNA-binding transcriptional LysR family regulator [Myxococcota bacterium]|jgi:DNA-binding transcriptional LysR family regulator
MQDVGWDDLQVFLAVVRHSTLNAAADALSVNHSTAWRRLKGLEQSVDAPLFERTSAGYALTEVGAAMLPHAERVEEEMFALARTIDGSNTTPDGTVTVTAPDSMLTLLTPLLARFRVGHPNIVVDVQLGDRFYDLDRHEADVAIRPGPQPPETAVGRRIADVAWTVYGPATVAQDECEQLPWVAYSEDLARLAAVQWRRERHAGTPWFVVNTVPGMRCLLSHGNCRGMLPCFAGDADPLLQRLQPPISAAESVLWLLIHTDMRRSARVRAFVDHAWRELRELRSTFDGSAHS